MEERKKSCQVAPRGKREGRRRGGIGKISSKKLFGGDRGRGGNGGGGVPKENGKGERGTYQPTGRL